MHMDTDTPQTTIKSDEQELSSHYSYNRNQLSSLYSYTLRIYVSISIPMDIGNTMQLPQNPQQGIARLGLHHALYAQTSRSAPCSLRRSAPCSLTCTMSLFRLGKTWHNRIMQGQHKSKVGMGARLAREQGWHRSGVAQEQGWHRSKVSTRARLA